MTTLLKFMKYADYRLICLILSLFLVTSCSQDEEKERLRVMSYNVRVSFADDGNNSWDQRKDILLRSIKKNAPHVLCLQEATPEVIAYLSKSLPIYNKFGRGRDKENSMYNESCHIFYDSTRFNIDSTQAGTFWLSNTPDEPGSISWNSAYKRICTHARFKDLSTGTYLHIFNTHWDHVSEQARDSSAYLLIERLNLYVRNNEPVVVTGDFNATEHDKSITNLMTNDIFPLVDAYRIIYPEPNGERDNTSHYGFTGNADSRIDYIFIKPGSKLHPADAMVDQYHENNNYPSDHFPVVMDFEF